MKVLIKYKQDNKPIEKLLVLDHVPSVEDELRLKSGVLLKVLKRRWREIDDVWKNAITVALFCEPMNG